MEIRDNGVVRLKGKKALTNMTRIKSYKQPSFIPSADETLASFYFYLFIIFYMFYINLH